MCLTCAGVGGVEWQGWVATVAMATALAPTTDSIVLTSITNAATGAARRKPSSLGEVTAICVTVALAL